MNALLLSVALLTFPIHDGQSLHDAVVCANQQCTGAESCLIVMDLPAEVGPRTITTPGPLPTITACDLTIISPRRPAGLDDVKHIITGTGFHFRPACENARITFNGFALVHSDSDVLTIGGPAHATYTLERLQISGAHRGIYVDAPNADVTIRETSISNTGRSAITVWSASKTFIDNVQTGVTRASGVFAGPFAGALTIYNSTLAHAEHFGLAIASGNAIVKLGTTRIFDNRAGDIDHGLDGPTDATTPVIVAVRPNEVVVDPRGFAGMIEVWSSDGLTMFGSAHLEHFVGRAETAGDFVTIPVTGAITGRYVSAIRLDGTRVTEVSPAFSRP